MTYLTTCVYLHICARTQANNQIHSHTLSFRLHKTWLCFFLPFVRLCALILPLIGWTFKWDEQFHYFLVAQGGFLIAPLPWHITSRPLNHVHSNLYALFDRFFVFSSQFIFSLFLSFYVFHFLLCVDAPFVQAYAGKVACGFRVRFFRILFLSFFILYYLVTARKNELNHDSF